MFIKKPFSGKFAILVTVLLLLGCSWFACTRLGKPTVFQSIGTDESGEYDAFVLKGEPGQSTLRLIAVHRKTREAYYVQPNQVAHVLYSKRHADGEGIVLDGPVDGESLSMLYGDSWFAIDAQLDGKTVRARLGNRSRRDSVTFTLP